ncbi:hypothetical protein ES705_39251 [subsurface metagenome]
MINLIIQKIVLNKEPPNFNKKDTKGLKAVGYMEGFFEGYCLKPDFGHYNYT